MAGCDSGAGGTVPGEIVHSILDGARLMLCIMRTTISLADRLATQVRREAAAQGVSVSAFIARTLDDALKRRAPAEPPKPFRLNSVGGNGPRLDIDLDRPRAVEAAEDEIHFGRRGA